MNTLCGEFFLGMGKIDLLQGFQEINLGKFFLTEQSEKLTAIILDELPFYQKQFWNCRLYKIQAAHR